MALSVDSAQWQVLISADSVRTFIDELDAIFRDPSCNTSEMRWELPQELNMVQVFHELLPLMNNDANVSRARKLITDRIKEHMLKSEGLEQGCWIGTLSQLGQANKTKPSTWLPILDGLMSTLATMPSSSRQPLTSKPPRSAAFVSGTMKDVTTVEYVDQEDRSRANFNMSASVEPKQAAEIATMLAAQGRAQSGAGEAIADRMCSLEDTLTSIVGNLSTLDTHVRSITQAPQTKVKTQQPPQGAALAKGRPPQGFNWDLVAGYAFCGYAPVPGRGTIKVGQYWLHGAECLLCSNFAGYTKFAAHEDLMKMDPPYPADIRAYHNAQMCLNFEKAVRAAGEKKTPPATEAEILEILVPVAKIPFKPNN